MIGGKLTIIVLWLKLILIETLSF